MAERNCAHPSFANAQSVSGKYGKTDVLGSWQHQSTTEPSKGVSNKQDKRNGKEYCANMQAEAHASGPY